MFHFNIYKKAFLICKFRARTHWPHVLLKDSMWLKKSRFSKIKDLNQKNKNMTSSGYPPSVTSQNWKSSNADLKIVVTHSDTVSYMKQNDRIFWVLWVSQCQKYQKSSFSCCKAQNIPHILTWVCGKASRRFVEHFSYA